MNYSARENQTQIEPLSFENTAYAFAYKKDSELKKAHFLFTTMGKQWLLKIGLTLLPIAIKLKIPFTKSIIRNTIFSQFVGGETLEQTTQIAQTLDRFDVKVILDYGAEGGISNEEGFNKVANEFVKVIDYAASQSNIPFISIKITGFARFSLLENMHQLMHDSNNPLSEKYLQALNSLSSNEKAEWNGVFERFEKICKHAASKNIGVLVDAEETWIQDPVDALTMLMMEKYNKEKVIVFNTIQLYRHDRLSFLKASFDYSQTHNFCLGVKLVRGAYMEKERARALLLNVPSPIQTDKAATDKDYDEAVDFCLAHYEKMATIVASHNEKSNLLATEIATKCKMPANHPHLHFSQLYGMSDNITFNLAKSGYDVSKYLPFGPIEEVIPYLMRRAQENSSVGGQTGRELGLIKNELKRRKQSG
jgi:proline dehydrogenase